MAAAWRARAFRSWRSRWKCSYNDPDQPYYPVNLACDREMYNNYAALQEELPNVIFGGRLARCKYYDMHQVIAGALSVARKRLKGIEE